MSMSKEEHQQRHIELHQKFDELFADWIGSNPQLKEFTTQPILVLLEWSHRQTVEPDHKPER